MSNDKTVEIKARNFLIEKINQDVDIPLQFEVPNLRKFAYVKQVPSIKAMNLKALNPKDFTDNAIERTVFDKETNANKVLAGNSSFYIIHLLHGLAMEKSQKENRTVENPRVLIEGERESMMNALSVFCVNFEKFEDWPEKQNVFNLAELAQLPASKAKKEKPNIKIEEVEQHEEEMLIEVSEDEEALESPKQEVKKAPVKKAAKEESPKEASKPKESPKTEAKKAPVKKAAKEESPKPKESKQEAKPKRKREDAENESKKSVSKKPVASTPVKKKAKEEAPKEAPKKAPVAKKAKEEAPKESPKKAPVAKKKEITKVPLAKKKEITKPKKLTKTQEMSACMQKFLEVQGLRSDAEYVKTCMGHWKSILKVADDRHLDEDEGGAMSD